MKESVNKVTENKAVDDKTVSNESVGNKAASNKNVNNKVKFSTYDNTPYDDAGKTMLHDCPAFIIPLVNEVFDEHYTGKEKIEFLREEDLLNLSEDETEKRYKDAYFKIIGEEIKRYHIELQSTLDSTIVLRMFEYDIGAALKESVLEGNKLIITISKSAVLYLRHNKNTPDALTIEIRTPGGDVSYEVPIVKTQTYTLDEIFEKKLLFLLPFYIFCYEKQFKELEEDEKKLQKLVEEYSKIKNRLNELHEKGELTEHEKSTIVSMTKKVVRNLAVNYKKIRKGVGSAMGGRVVKHEAQVLTEKGIKKGIELGRDMERANIEAANKRVEEALKQVNETEQENKKLKELLIKQGILPAC